jgi:psp operon transcriptional activator
VDTSDFVTAEDFEVGSIGFKHQVQEYEKKILREALKQCQFNQRKTAKLLDLSYDQLRGYLRKYDLNT